MSDSLAWFLRDGVKDIGIRIATSATLVWGVVPRVPLVFDALIAFIVLLLLLGPVILGLGRLLDGVQGRSPEADRRRSTAAGNLRLTAISVFLSAVIAGTGVYLVGEQAAQRHAQEERREFAEKQVRRQKERRIDEREERQKRQAVEARLVRARLASGRIQVSTFIRRARREYWSWEYLLLNSYGVCPETRAIMREVGHDLRNIDRARGRVESLREAKVLSREIRRWIQGSVRNRKLVEAGAREYQPVRFVFRQI